MWLRYKIMASTFDSERSQFSIVASNLPLKNSNGTRDTFVPVISSWKFLTFSCCQSAKLLAIYNWKWANHFWFIFCNSFKLEKPFGSFDEVGYNEMLGEPYLIDLNCGHRYFVNRNEGLDWNTGLTEVEYHWNW